MKLHGNVCTTRIQKTSTDVISDNSEQTRVVAPTWKHRPCKYCGGSHFDRCCLALAPSPLRRAYTSRIVNNKHFTRADVDGDIIMNEWTTCAYCLAALKSVMWFFILWSTDALCSHKGWRCKNHCIVIKLILNSWIWLCRREVCSSSALLLLLLNAKKQKEGSQSGWGPWIIFIVLSYIRMQPAKSCAVTCDVVWLRKN